MGASSNEDKEQVRREDQIVVKYQKTTNKSCNKDLKHCCIIFDYVISFTRNIHMAGIYQEVHPY